MILVDEGQSPLILCLPHSGTDIPPAITKRLNATGRLQTDLSWRLEDVFNTRKDLGVTVIRSTISRYVIDLDKDPETPLSEAMDPTVALCPATTLDGKNLYQDEEEPGSTEIEQRMLLFHVPFHRALRQQIERVSRLHDKVIILDCQSMRSHIRGVTDKGLPLVSIGSFDGTSCDPDLRNLLVGSFTGQKGFTVEVDDKAKGGFITQSYGRPDRNLHAMTLLFAQRAYLRHESPPFEPDKTRVRRLRTIMEDSLSRLIDWAGMPPAGALSGEDNSLFQEQDSDAVADASDTTLEDQLVETSSGSVTPLTEASLPDAGASEIGKVEDGPVKPLLIAE
ncbi:MAG: N-formylglutamate amidohydrolase [Roseibium sp.]